MNKVVKNILLILMLIFLTSAVQAQAKAADKGKQANKGDDAKQLSGISIVGNKEAPKSLFIVPWKSSELGVETSLSSSLLNEKLKPVDKDVFARELDFYSIAADE